MTSLPDRSQAAVQLVRGLSSRSADTRRSHADLPVEWIGMQLLGGPEQAVVGQVCVWAWTIEPDPHVRHDLLESINAQLFVLPPTQVVGVFAAVDRTTTDDLNNEMLSEIDEFLAEHVAVAPWLLAAGPAGRAIDLVRGLTSADPRERLSATRLAADVVASRDLADEEAGCFAGLLSYAVVIESDPAVRHEQATVLAIAAHHGRLSDDHREIALAADLTADEKAALTNTGPAGHRQGT